VSLLEQSTTSLNRFVVTKVTQQLEQYPTEYDRKSGDQPTVCLSSLATSRCHAHPAGQVSPPTYLHAPLAARLGDTSRPMVAEQHRQPQLDDENCVTASGPLVSVARGQNIRDIISSSCCSPVAISVTRD